MDCRTKSANKFRTRLRFKQYDVILTKEQSLPTKIMSSFEGENMQTLYVLSYTFLCFLCLKLYIFKLCYTLAIEIDENRHSNGNFDYEIKRRKAIEQELCRQFITIDLHKEGFDVFRTQSKHKILFEFRL